jgi:hypothetical protein
VETWWDEVTGPDLAQGDLIPHCLVPLMPADATSPTADESDSTFEFKAAFFDLIVVTQSCDLENNKAPFVATCAVREIRKYIETNPHLTGKNRWEDIRKGRIEGLFLLQSPVTPDDAWAGYVADLRMILSLPVLYLSTRAAHLGPRHRLKSPYLESFSQTFAQCFMRVALPTEGSYPAFT